jgi:hypothetical protein
VFKAFEYFQASEIKVGIILHTLPMRAAVTLAGCQNKGPTEVKEPVKEPGYESSGEPASTVDEDELNALAESLTWAMTMAHPQKTSLG